jgi:hypothetical protein
MTKNQITPGLKTLILDLEKALLFRVSGIISRNIIKNQRKYLWGLLQPLNICAKDYFRILNHK